MTDFNTSDRDVNRAIRSWLRQDRHEDASRLAGVVLDHLDTTPQRRATWWPARRAPLVSRIVSFGLAAAVAVIVLVVGAQLFGSRSNVGSDGGPAPTTQATSDSSASPSTSPRPSRPPRFFSFTSTIHGISIDYPLGWQIRRATEPWTGGPLNFDSRAADVLFNPRLGDRLYILLASQPRRGAGQADQHDDQTDQFDLIAESGVCDPEGGAGGGSFTVDGASAWGQSCAPGISGATSVEAVAVTTENRGYLIALVASGAEPELGHDYDFDAALETVDLRPDEAR